MALAATAENFLMINRRNDGRSLRRMAGLAQVAAGDVGRWFARVN